MMIRIFRLIVRVALLIALSFLFLHLMEKGMQQLDDKMTNQIPKEITNHENN
jgi:hypothetical protein